MAAETETLITLTADIVSAHVSNNSVATGDVGGLIEKVFAALQGLGAPAEPVEEKPKGAVSVRASIKPDHIVSMIDGKPYKMMKRHLSQNGYTPQSYREAFGLPKDYPMVAASYAEQRSPREKEWPWSQTQNRSGIRPGSQARSKAESEKGHVGNRWRLTGQNRKPISHPPMTCRKGLAHDRR